MADCTLDPCTNFSHCPPTAIIENTSVTVALPVITIFFVIMFVIGAVLGCIDMMTKNFRSCGIAGVMLMVAAACLWLFWVGAFISQLNPLIGPEIKTGIVGHIRKEWPGSYLPNGSMCQRW